MKPQIERLESRQLLSGSSVVNSAAAVTAVPVSLNARQMEYLNRGVVAIRQSTSTTGGIYVGWRMLGTDPTTIGFNLYCSTNGAAAVKLNSSPLMTTTDYVHASQTYSQSHAYFVKPVINGVEQAASETFTLAANVAANQYLNIPLQIPAGLTMPDGTTCTYNANDCSVGDLDGDGQYEIVVKWDPSNSKDNAQSGYTGNVYLDAYKLNGTRLWRIDLGRNIRAGAHYTQFMVYDLDGDGKAEVACKTADATISGTGQVIGDGNADWRNTSGYILTGPEYLTIFNGQTGGILVTINYNPPRGNVSSWGDNYGNRVDRFLACVAYLDGQRPSLVMCRGYYTRAVLVAYDWRNGQLTQRWIFDSNTPGNGGYAGQGNHNLSVGDVDGDGKDEIVYGACAIDDNGKGLYNTGLGHGDAMHLGDLDPDRPGLEVFDIHEAVNPTAGGEFRDAGTGALIWGKASTGDTGRGVSDDVYAGTRGAESWAGGGVGGLYDRYGNLVGRAPGSCNFLAWWDGDHVRELLNNTTISKYGLSADTTLLTASGCSSNNSTKATPNLSADILGDWREEVIWRTSDNTALRIYTTTTPATDRMYTLMHDTQYREGIAWQNVAYNQPPHPSFYLGDGMSAPPTPNIYLVASDALGPAAPTDLNAVAAPPRRVDLTWTASTGAVSYNLKRAFIPGGPYTTIATGLTQTSYSDLNLAVGQTWYYVVSGVNASGNEGADSIQTSATLSGTESITQAENASYGGGTVFETVNGGFNGTGYVNFSTTGGFLEFDNVNGGGGGPATIRFRFALGAASSRTGTLSINGVTQSITFNPTGSWTTWSLYTLTTNLNPGATNTIRLNSTGQDLANVDELQTSVLVDTIAPTVNSSNFFWDASPNVLTFTFSESVQASLQVTDILVQPTGGGTPVSVSGYTYDVLTNTASFQMPAPLADGNYTATFLPGSVTDGSGNALDSAFGYNFFVLGGDANHDRIVDVRDLLTFATNWQSTGKTFSQGDFNYDGVVDVADLTILSQNWQKTLADSVAAIPISLFARPVKRTAVRVISLI